MIIEELVAAVAMSIVYATMGVLLLIEAVMTLVGLVLELVVSLVLRDRSAGRAAGARAAAVSAAAGSGRARLAAFARSRWVRRIGIASGVCLGLTLLAILTLNFLFFDWSVRKILDEAGGEAGSTSTLPRPTGAYSRAEFDSAASPLSAGMIR